MAFLKGPIKTDPWFNHVNLSDGGRGTRQNYNSGQNEPEEVTALWNQTRLLNIDKQAFDDDYIQQQAFAILRKHNGNRDAWRNDPELKKLYQNMFRDRQLYSANEQLSETNKKRQKEDYDKIKDYGTKYQWHLIQNKDKEWVRSVNAKGEYETVTEHVNNAELLDVNPDGMYEIYEPIVTTLPGTLNAEIGVWIDKASKGNIGSYSTTKPLGREEFGISVQEMANGEKRVFIGTKTTGRESNVINIVGGKAQVGGKEISIEGVGGIVNDHLSSAAQVEAKDLFYKETDYNSEWQERISLYEEKLKEINPSVSEGDIRYRAESIAYKQWLKEYADNYAYNSIKDKTTSSSSYEYSSGLSSLLSSRNDKEGLGEIASFLAGKLPPTGSNNILVMDNHI